MAFLQCNADKAPIICTVRSRRRAGTDSRGSLAVPAAGVPPPASSIPPGWAAGACEAGGDLEEVAASCFGGLDGLVGRCDLGCPAAKWITQSGSAAASAALRRGPSERSWSVRAERFRHRLIPDAPGGRRRPLYETSRTDGRGAPIFLIKRIIISDFAGPRFHSRRGFLIHLTGRGKRYSQK